MYANTCRSWGILVQSPMKHQRSQTETDQTDGLGGKNSAASDSSLPPKTQIRQEKHDDFYESAPNEGVITGRKVTIMGKRKGRKERKIWDIWRLFPRSFGQKWFFYPVPFSKSQLIMSPRWKRQLLVHQFFGECDILHFPPISPQRGVDEVKWETRSGFPVATFGQKKTLFRVHNSSFFGKEK